MPVSASRVPPPSGGAGTTATFARWWLISLAVWNLLALLAVTQGHLSAMQRGLVDPGDGAAWWRTLAGWLPRYELWALLSPPIFWLATRFAIHRERLGSRIALHAVTSACVAVIGAALHSAVICAIWPHPSYWAHVQKMLLANFTDGLVTYWIVLLAAHAWAFRQLARDRALAAAKLDARLKSAELATLRLQLNPHFLFNALNTLAVLMREDEAAADRLLERLSLFLRAVLAGSSREDATLAEELELLDHYLAVESARFGERLVVRREIAADALEARVPRLVLQPIVENAIKHAVAPRKAGGVITLSARIQGDTLELSVADDGPGWKQTPPTAAIGGGVGLANTQLRLEKRYGPRQRLELAHVHAHAPAPEPLAGARSPGENPGALVRIILPHVPTDDDAAT